MAQPTTKPYGTSGGGPSVVLDCSVAVADLSSVWEGNLPPTSSSLVMESFVIGGVLGEKVDAVS